MTEKSELLAKDAAALLRARKFGALATQSRQYPGHPFGSVASYAVDAQGRPIFLLSYLAIHSANIAADNRVSLLVFAPEVEEEPLSSARLTVIGRMEPAPDADLPELRRLYLERHPAAAEFIDFGDFTMYRMAVEQSYYVAGFGKMGWVAPPA